MRDDWGKIDSLINANLRELFLLNTHLGVFR